MHPFVLVAAMSSHTRSAVAAAAKVAAYVTAVALTAFLSFPMLHPLQVVATEAAQTAGAPVHLLLLQQ